MAEKLEIIIEAKDKSSHAIRSVGSSLGGLGATAGKVAVGGLLAATAAVAGLSVGIGKLISIGSDNEEMMGKFNVVFGDYATKTIEDLDAMTASMGRSKFEARGFAASFQDTFVPMGFARGEAAELSKTLTELTYDVASFNNSLEADVARDFQSALVGNTETVRKYGIVINQDILEQELFNMGLRGGANEAAKKEKKLASLTGKQEKYAQQLEVARMELYKLEHADHKDSIRITKKQNQIARLEESYAKAGTEIENVGNASIDMMKGVLENATEQEKVQARLNLLMKGTTDAQGDAERTSGSWANQMRALSAAFTDTATEIGAALLPVFTPFLSKLREFVQTVGPQVADFITEKIIPAFTNFSSAVLTAFDEGGMMGVFQLVKDTISAAWNDRIVPELERMSEEFWGWMEDPERQKKAEEAGRETGANVIRAFEEALHLNTEGATERGFWDELSSSMMALGDKVTVIIGPWVKGFFDVFLEKLAELDWVGRLRDFFSSIFTSDFWSGIIGGFGSFAGYPGFASGGFVPGPMGAAQPAIVHGGELVLNPQQQQQLMFNLTVNSRASTSSVIQDFNMLRSMAGV